MKILLLGLLCSVLLLGTALADSWAPPSVESYVSVNGKWKLTVYPRGLSSQFDYFQDKVDGKPNAGGIPGDSQASPIGHMQHRRDGRWRTAWKAQLVNDVAPAQAVVANDGTTATFDNWHSVGWGDDAVVLYAPDGQRIRAFGLSAFLPKQYINAMPRSVSSLHWRGKPRIDEARRELVIPVVVPSEDMRDAYTDRERYVEVRFLLTDGSLLPPSGPAWDAANRAAVREDARRKQLQEEFRQRFVSPLPAPRSQIASDWHVYLREAFQRVDPDWQHGYPSTQVVAVAPASNAAQTADYLGAALAAKPQTNRAIMLASPSQDTFLQAVQQQATRVKPGALANVRVYVAADSAHMTGLRMALAHTGAEMIQLDIDGVIPQRQERIDIHMKNQSDAED